MQGSKLTYTSSGIFYKGKHYSPTEMPPGFDTTFGQYCDEFNKIPQTCTGPLTFIHSKNIGKVEQQDNFVNWRVEAMKIAGWTLKQKFDLKRSYLETHGRVDRLHEIVGKIFWAIYRSELKPDTPSDLSKPIFNHYGDADTIKGRYKSGKYRVAIKKTANDRYAQFESHKKCNAREHDQLVNSTVKKLPADENGQWYINCMADNDSLATLQEFMAFRNTPEFKSGWETRHQEWNEVCVVPENLRKYSHKNVAKKNNPDKVHHLNLSTMSQFLVEIAIEFQVYVQFTPGRMHGDTRVIFEQDKYNQFGLLPIDGRQGYDYMEGIMHCFTPYNAKYGFSLGLTEPVMWRKVLPDRFSVYTKHPTFGLPDALNLGHLQYGNCKNLVFFIKGLNGRSIKYVIDKFPFAHHAGIQRESVLQLIQELHTPMICKKNFSIPQPLPKQNVHSDLEIDKRKVQNKKDQRAEAKIASLNREADKIKNGLKKPKPVPASSRISVSEMLKQMKDLKELLDDGALSLEEFWALKAKILSQ